MSFHRHDFLHYCQSTGQPLWPNYMELYTRIIATATVTSNRHLDHLWSKIVLFITVWRCLKVLPLPCPPLHSILHVRAFKWVTVWHFISKGIKTTASYFKVTTLLNKNRLFWNFLLCLLVILMLLSIKHHIVPHLKGLNSVLKP